MASSPLQLSGLASGFDWKTFVDSMMEAERTPITRLTTEKSTNTSRINVLDNFKTRMTDLQTAAKALSGEGLFAGRTTKLSSSQSAWTASAASGTAVGTYTVAVSQLATATRHIGTGNIGPGLSTTSDVSGVTLATMATGTAVTAGDFTINGARVQIALTDSLQDVFSKISTATGGQVTAAYNPTDDKITLQSATQISLGASNDTSNFLRVTRLANNGTGTIGSETSLGTVKTAAPLRTSGIGAQLTAVDGSGNGSFTINGVNISYNVDTDSLNSVLSRINASTAGVSASYDAAADRVVLTNKTTGNLGLHVSEAAGGFLGAVGITGGTTASGKNALFSINNGVTLSSTTNTLDSAVHGIPGLIVSAASEATETINIGSDTAASRKVIDDFISKFNSVQALVDDQSKVTSTNGKVTAAVMSNNREFQSWATSLRSSAFAEVAGLSGTIKRLEHLGIDFATGTGPTQLVIKDGAKLDAALADKASEVEAFFKTASTGFAARINSFAENVLGTGTTSTGLLNSQKSTLLSQNTGIDKQIADIERRLVQQRSLLESGFIAMEQAQSMIQQMQQQLAKAFPTT